MITLSEAPVQATRKPALPWVSWGLLAAAGVVALEPVTPTWETNSNYSFGWLIPLVALFLFAERWPARPRRQGVQTPPLAPLLAAWAFVFFAFRLAVETDFDWRPGLWVLVGLYVAACLGWLALYGGRAWARHFAFPVGFLFLCLPWFFGIEYPLVQGLMRWNAIAVATTLQWLAVPAVPAGNIIHLQNCDLGVEEACSGILSLQASLMMGFLLGEIYRLTTRRRVGLIATALTLALLGNYLRTFFLAIMAFYNGAGAVTQWHDTAGYAILVFTGVGTWLAALAIGSFPVARIVPGSAPVPRRFDEGQTRTALRFALAIFAVALVAEAATQAWFGWRESSLPRHPEWTAQMTATPGFKKVALSVVTLEALRCDFSQAGQWQDERGWNWNVYWLSYDPKPYTRIVLGWHTPDNCLPSVGLIKDRDYPPFSVGINGIDFRVQPKKFLSKGLPVYLFWVVYPLQGDIPAPTDTRGTKPFNEKFQTHLHYLLSGDRGVGVETLEIALTGPADYESAKAAYLEKISAMIAPGKAPGG